jgi:hypothetical protein
MRLLLAAGLVQAQEQEQVLTGLAQGPRQQVVRQAPMALDRLFRGATVAAVQQQQQQ